MLLQRERQCWALYFKWKYSAVTNVEGPFSFYSFWACNILSLRPFSLARVTWSRASSLVVEAVPLLFSVSNRSRPFVPLSSLMQKSDGGSLLDVEAKVVSILACVLISLCSRRHK